MEKALPAPRLSSRLETVRRGFFVGRDKELEGFDQALDGADARVLLVHGRTGFGKTTLLRECARRARARGRTVLELSGTGDAPVGQLLSGDLLEDGAGQGAEDVVVLVDDAACIEEQLRTRILPDLPSSSVVVLATNAPPSAEWELDLGWRSLVRAVPLGPLSEDEGLELLVQLGVAPDAQAELWSVSDGHPLTLALLAPHWSHDGLAALGRRPDLGETLLGKLAGGPFEPAQIDALFVCSHAASASQEMLRDVLGVSDVSQVWSWLCSLGVVDRDMTGIRLSAVCSHLVEGHMLDRSMERSIALHSAIHTSARERLDENRQIGSICLGPVKSLFSGHSGSALSHLWGSRAVAQVWPRRGNLRDVPAVAAMLRRGAGDEEAALVQSWVEEQPGSLFIAEEEGEIAAAAVGISITLDEGRECSDHLVRRAVRYVEAGGMARPNDTVQILRAVTDRAGRRDSTLAVYLGVVAGVVEWLLKYPSLALALGPFDRRWQRVLTDLAMRPVEGTDFGGSRMFAFDFRRMPPNEWFTYLTRRGMSGSEDPPRTWRPAALGYAQFSDAVQRALRDLHRTDRLVANPLAESALIAESGPLVAQALRDRILSAVRSVGASGRDELLSRVLEVSYVQHPYGPESAAVALDLPAVAYRQYLDQGVRRVVDLLWMSEITRVPTGRALS